MSCSAGSRQPIRPCLPPLACVGRPVPFTDCTNVVVDPLDVLRHQVFVQQIAACGTEPASLYMGVSGTQTSSCRGVGNTGDFRGIRSNPCGNGFGLSSVGFTSTSGGPYSNYNFGCCTGTDAPPSTFGETGTIAVFDPNPGGICGCRRAPTPVYQAGYRHM